MTQFVIQKFDGDRWADDAESFSPDEAMIFLREAKREYGAGMARMVRRRLFA